MKKEFAASGAALLWVIISFAVLAFLLIVGGAYGPGLFLAFLTAISGLRFAWGYQKYVVNDEAFYIVNAVGTKIYEITFEDMVKIYTLKGMRSYSNRYDDGYEDGVILKIQMTSGEIFKLDLDTVRDGYGLMDALVEQLGEHRFHFGHR
jgi:hypothetical protein